METKKRYILLKDLEVYKLARELSKIAWKVYEGLSWQEKKTMGDQFIESVDSIGANIAEGYGRHHFLDQIKFYYNARGSFNECCQHWIEILNERKKVDAENYKQFKDVADKLSLKLNNFISAIYRVKAINGN